MYEMLMLKCNLCWQLFFSECIVCEPNSIKICPVISVSYHFIGRLFRVTYRLIHISTSHLRIGMPIEDRIHTHTHTPYNRTVCNVRPHSTSTTCIRQSTPLCNVWPIGLFYFYEWWGEMARPIPTSNFEVADKKGLPTLLWESVRCHRILQYRFSQRPFMVNNLGKDFNIRKKK